MDTIPDEILMIILDFLPGHVLCTSAARVCRRWARLCARRAVLVPGARRRCRVSSGVRCMLLLATDPLLPASIPYLPCATTLTELTVHLGLPLSSKDMMALSELRLRHCDVFCRAEVLGDAALALASRLTSLVVNEPVAPGFFSTLAEQNNLQALHMYGRAGSYPREELMDLLYSHYTHFRDLTLRCPLLEEADYAAIGRCSWLVSLQLYACWELTPAAARHLAGLRHLRKLHLTGTRRISSDEWVAVASCLPPRLEELALSASRADDELAPALAARLPRLAALELWRTRLSPAALLRLAARLPRLQELDVDMRLSASELAALARHPSLRRLRCRDPLQERAGRISIRSTADCHLGRLKRSEREGFRSELFYYWAQHLPPQLLPAP